MTTITPIPPQTPLAKTNKWTKGLTSRTNHLRHKPVIAFPFRTKYDTDSMGQTSWTLNASLPEACSNFDCTIRFKVFHFLWIAYRWNTGCWNECMDIRREIIDNSIDVKLVCLFSDLFIFWFIYFPFSNNKILKNIQKHAKRPQTYTWNLPKTIPNRKWYESVLLKTNFKIMKFSWTKHTNNWSKMTATKTFLQNLIACFKLLIHYIILLFFIK